jgi:hypothetical protein
VNKVRAVWVGTGSVRRRVMMRKSVVRSFSVATRPAIPSARSWRATFSQSGQSSSSSSGMVDRSSKKVFSALMVLRAVSGSTGRASSP